MTWTIIITILLTLLVVALAMNFARPEKKLEHMVLHKYALSDPQFKREMSTLLGPSVVSGNQIVTILDTHDLRLADLIEPNKPAT